MSYFSGLSKMITEGREEELKRLLDSGQIPTNYLLALIEYAQKLGKPEIAGLLKSYYLPKIVSPRTKLGGPKLQAAWNSIEKSVEEGNYDEVEKILNRERGIITIPPNFYENENMVSYILSPEGKSLAAKLNPREWKLLLYHTLKPDNPYLFGVLEKINNIYGDATLFAFLLPKKDQLKELPEKDFNAILNYFTPRSAKLLQEEHK